MRPASTSNDEVVARAAAERRAVLAAYVFGSRARGEAGAKSDLDVGLLLFPGERLSLDEEGRLRADLARETGLEIDVAFLADRAPVLCFEVLSTGRRVFVRDAEIADELEERLLRHYLDTEHLRRVQREYLFGSTR